MLSLCGVPVSSPSFGTKGSQVQILPLRPELRAIPGRCPIPISGTALRVLKMPYAQRVILHAPAWDSPALGDFVEACLRDGVRLVCVIGNDCRRVEDVIDELVVGDGTDPNRFLTTTSHPDESLEEVKAFAEAW